MKNLLLLFTLLAVGCAPVQKQLAEQLAVAEKTARADSPEQICDKCAASSYSAPAPEPDTSFTFSNSKKLLICGYPELQGDKIIYSEFVLSECGNDSIIGYWGAVEAYELDYKQDTLLLHKIELLASGENREFVKEKWLTEYFYYDKDRLQKEKKLNRQIGYSQSQIEQTLQEYENTKWLTQINSSEAYTEEKMELANRLMLAAASGSKKAESYFKEFDRNFRPDGAYAEWYNQMADLLVFAKS